MAKERGVSEAEVEQRWLATVPEGRLAEPSEVAAAIGFWLLRKLDLFEVLIWRSMADAQRRLPNRGIEYHAIRYIFSISQTPVNGEMPNEAGMFASFFDQVELADVLGFEVAWVAESHLSSEVQKTNKAPVIPHWKGRLDLTST